MALATTFSGLPAYAAEPAAAPVAGPVDPATYVRFEQIVQDWALNIGFKQGDKSDGADAQLWTWTNPSDWNSQWRKTLRGDGYLTYRNRWSGKCLGVENFTFAARVEQQTCDGSKMGQLWTESYVGEVNGRSAYTVRNKGASFELGWDMLLTADSTYVGAPVRVWPAGVGTPDTQTRQRWYESFVREF